MSLVVYKSSAGSGKTTTLVNEYLSLALVKPDRFGNIIALTFTIKATTEMKQRVFTILDKIINVADFSSDAGLESSIEHIKNATKLTETEIRNRSKKLLRNILHNYTDFSFSTIDSFVVSIVRSFAHDLNLPLDFGVELDSGFLIEQAIAKLFEKIGEDEKLTQFLIQYILQNADKEASIKIENELANLAKILFESRHYKSIEKLSELDLEHFTHINKSLKSDIHNFENHLKKLAQVGLRLIEENSIDHHDFSRSTLPKQFQKIVDGDIDIEHTIFTNPEDNSFYAQSKSEVIKDRIDAIRPELVMLINRIKKRFDEKGKDYINKKLILEKLNPLALLSEIKKMLNEYSEENNVIHLSESNKMIADIVLNEHIPFIYERVGRKYLHFLIDEFQDTSVIQWNNIIPLIDNSLSTDNFNMIVGDAKQSIYRWRDGEVDQFINLPSIANADSSEIMKERSDSIKRNYIEKRLKHNYRSEVNIIEFNNAFFDFLLAHPFVKDKKTYINGDSKRISKIYASHQQTPGKKTDNGRIIIHNYPKGGEQSYEEGLIAHIEELISQGYQLQDIAVIARTKDILATASETLIRNDYSVVSNETLYIVKNPQVSLLVSIMSFIGNSDRKNNLLNIMHLLSKDRRWKQKVKLTSFSHYLNNIGHNQDIEVLCQAISNFEIILSPSTLQELQTYDLVEYLISALQLNTAPNPFIQSLLNYVLENSQKNGSGLKAFLEFWEQKKDKISINLPDNIDAISLYTIHKAKGLEFPVVIFPANGFVNSSSDFHWINPEEIGIEGLSTAMIKHKKELISSSFKEQYLDEEDKKRMDNLNLIYVANTRPTEQLIILFDGTKPSAWHMFKDFTIDSPKFVTHDENFKTYGSIITHRTRKKKTNDNQIRKIISQPWGSRIQLKHNSNLGISDENHERLEKGKTMHYLLSQVKDAESIKPILRKSILQGLIKDEEKEFYEKELFEIVNHPDYKIFFESENIEISECAILLPNGKQVRPDKVIIYKNKTIIIDYKLSDYDNIDDDIKEKHSKQVNNYRKLLQEMSFPDVKAYLIYIDGNKKCIEVN